MSAALITFCLIVLQFNMLQIGNTPASCAYSLPNNGIDARCKVLVLSTQFFPLRATTITITVKEH